VSESWKYGEFDITCEELSHTGDRFSTLFEVHRGDTYLGSATAVLVRTAESAAIKQLPNGEPEARLRLRVREAFMDVGRDHLKQFLAAGGTDRLMPNIPFEYLRVNGDDQELIDELARRALDR